MKRFILFHNKSKSSQKNNVKSEDTFSDPLEEIFLKVQKSYPLKKYILIDDISQNLSAQSEILYSVIPKTEQFPNAFYSYITFHQIYFHLKNFLLLKKKKLSGYKFEFLDMFQDIFWDNYIIFKNIHNILKEENKIEYFKFLNIWLDGFFINLFKNLVDSPSGKYHKIQPELFFLSILFVALPSISEDFKTIPFTEIINFDENTNKDFNNALNKMSDYDFNAPLSKKSLEQIRNFIGIFFDMDVSIKGSYELFLDEYNSLKCVDFIKTLIDKSDEMVENIKRIRSDFTGILL